MNPFKNDPATTATMPFGYGSGMSFEVPAFDRALPDDTTPCEYRMDVPPTAEEIALLNERADAPTVMLRFTTPDDLDRLAELANKLAEDWRGFRGGVAELANKSSKDWRGFRGDTVEATDDIVRTEKSGWFVWTKTGSMPRKRHKTRSIAEREAARLAAKFPGKKFIVLQMVSKFNASEATAFGVDQ